MPLAQIRIEQLEGNRWNAEIEAGGMPGNPLPFRRSVVNAPTFSEVLDAVAAQYREQVPENKPADVMPESVRAPAAQPPSVSPPAAPIAAPAPVSPPAKS